MFITGSGVARIFPGGRGGGGGLGFRRGSSPKMVLIFRRNKQHKNRHFCRGWGGGGGRTTIYKGIKRSNKHVLKHMYI